MKTIGLLGGLSWESSTEYYRIVNQASKQILGGQHSAKCILFSVDFGEIEALRSEGRWDDIGEALLRGARKIATAGAEFLLICSNTMHKVYPSLENCLPIPVLHIADVTAQEVLAKGIKRVGLVGTQMTMEESFYRERLEAHGLHVTIPAQAERENIHRIIYDELCMGHFREDSKSAFLQVFEGLMENGAQGIILGCTEIPMLVQQKDLAAPIFDTTRIHAEKAVHYAVNS